MRGWGHGCATSDPNDWGLHHQMFKMARPPSPSSPSLGRRVTTTRPQFDMSINSPKQGQASVNKHGPLRPWPWPRMDVDVDVDVDAHNQPGTPDAAP